MNAGFFSLWLAFVAAILLLSVASLGLGIWTIVDAARRPDYQYQVSGQSKVLWIVLPAAGFASCQLVTLVAAGIYLLNIRKKLDAVAPPPGWGALPYPGFAPYPPPSPTGDWPPAPPSPF